MDNVKLNIGLEDLPEELEGKTFEDVFKAVMTENNRLLGVMREKFGNTTWDEEKENFFTQKEQWYLRAGQWIKSFSNA